MWKSLNGFLSTLRRYARAWYSAHVRDAGHPAAVPTDWQSRQLWMGPHGPSCGGFCRWDASVSDTAPIRDARGAATPRRRPRGLRRYPQRAYGGIGVQNKHAGVAAELSQARLVQSSAPHDGRDYAFPKATARLGLKPSPRRTVQRARPPVSKGTTPVCAATGVPAHSEASREAGHLAALFHRDRGYPGLRNGDTTQGRTVPLSGIHVPDRPTLREQAEINSLQPPPSG